MGKVFKKRRSLFSKTRPESKRGYIITVFLPDTKMKYRLFRSASGVWSKDPDGLIRLDESDLIIKDAIIEKEKEGKPD